MSKEEQVEKEYPDADKITMDAGLREALRQMFVADNDTVQMTCIIDNPDQSKTQLMLELKLVGVEAK